MRILKNLLFAFGLCVPILAHGTSTYTTPENVDVSKAQTQTDLGAVYTTNGVEVCPAGTVVSGSYTATDADRFGALYSVGDIIYLDDGSVIRLTSVNNGQLVDGGWTYLTYGANKIDVTTTASRFTTALNSSDSIKNKSSALFKPGCLMVKSTSLPLGNPTTTPAAIPAVNNSLDILVPSVVNDPDGSWPSLDALLNTAKPYGSTYTLSDKARLPINYNDNNNTSPITINPENYNRIRLLSDTNI